MKWHPMLFKGDMIRALLEDRKVQSRRIPTCANTLVDGKRVSAKAWKAYDFDWSTAETDHGLCWFVKSRAYRTLHSVSAIWRPGDRLWGREAHAIPPKTAYWHDQSIPHRESPDGDFWAVYRQGWERVQPGPWKPSIHMPRWASRISLEVKDVRVERVQEISEADAQAEGCDVGCRKLDCDCARKKFRELWDSINAKRGYGFDTNHPVHVLGFERIKA